jgi:hypothetical protein
VGDRKAAASSTAPSRRSGDSARGDFLCEGGVVLHRIRSGLCWNGIQAPRPGVRRSRPEAEPLAASSASCVTAFWTSLLPMDLGLVQPLGTPASAWCWPPPPYWLRITSRRLETEREHPDLSSSDDDGDRRNDFLWTLALPPRGSSLLITSQESFDLQFRDFLSAVHHTAGAIFPNLCSYAPTLFFLVDGQIREHIDG